MQMDPLLDHRAHSQADSVERLHVIFKGLVDFVLGTAPSRKKIRSKERVNDPFKQRGSFRSGKPGLER